MAKRVKSAIAVIIAIAIIVTPNAFALNTAKAASVYDEAAKQAQQMAETLTSPAVYGETSLQYALIDNGKIVISGQAGVYSKEEKNAVTSENMYGVGSISKIFTTAAVMQLVDQGKVKLDTPVVKYLPDFKMADKRYKKITVRMLLNHSSGLMGSTFKNTMLFEDSDTQAMDQLLEELKTQRLKADPGAFSVYCNDGFSLAQLLVEKVSGINFSDFVKKNLTGPLKMDNTKTPLDQFDRSRLVQTYTAAFSDALPTEDVAAIGAGGIYSTAEDMCHMAQIFMFDSENEILSNQSAEKMAGDEYLSGMWCPDEDSILNFGLGWDSVNTFPFTRYGIKALVKGGDTLAFHGSLIVLPEENMAMAVLSSGGSSVYNEAMAQEILIKVLAGKGKLEEKPDLTFTVPQKAEMPESEMENSGFYALTGGIIKAEVSSEGVASIYNAGAVPQKFTYGGGGKFYYMDGSAYISFEREENGNTYLYVHNYLSYPYLGQMASASYQAQKIEENKLPKKVKAVWEKREGRYLMINEKYSSETYALSSPITSLSMSSDIEGYIGSTKIIDTDTAKVMFQIPGTFGRDCSDISFFLNDKVEYMKVGAFIFIPETEVKNFSVKPSFKVSIAQDGYAKWYKISSETKDKKIKITVPEKASFSVYDSNGSCTYCSLISGTEAVVLPKDGTIVFAGEKDAEFTVRYLK